MQGLQVTGRPFPLLQPLIPAGPPKRNELFIVTDRPKGNCCDRCILTYDGHLDFVLQLLNELDITNAAEDSKQEPIAEAKQRSVCLASNQRR